MPLTAPEPTSSEFQFIGQRRRRTDAPERLTGQVRFAGDLAFPGALHARLVRSPYGAARIKSVDRRAALATPGVAAVVTAADLPLVDPRRAAEDRLIPLAFDRADYAGHPVAVVLGETESAAADGAAAVEVDYETGDVVVDPLRALDPHAPVVREQGDRNDEELAMHGAAPSAVDETDTPQAPNVASRTRFRRGHVEEGFGEADVVVEREYRTSWVHQGYIEPQSCVALVDPLGTLTVYTATQALFHTRTEVCRALGLDDHQVKVHAMPVGGGFGGKFGLLEPLTAALAKYAGRPVRLVYSRMDDQVAANPASQSVIRVKVGARRDGTLTTLQANLVFDAGSKAGAPLGIAAILLGGSYRWQHLLLEGSEVLTHKASTGAYRAPGAPQATFAIESTVDEAARALGIDPLALRRQNAVVEGDLRPDGTRWPLIGLAECLARAAEVYEAERARCGPGEGVGVALGGWPGGVEPAAAACRLNKDGTLQVSLGSVDLTGTNDVFAQVVAEAFGLQDPAMVRVSTVDTDAAPYAGATGGSKITYTVGAAVLEAARDARQQVLKIAAAELEASMDDLEIVNGSVRVKGVPGRVKTLGEIASLSMGFGMKYPPVQGRGQSAITERSPGFAVHVVRVHVDRETGSVTPRRYVAIQDVGRALNPALVEGQLFGGAVQSVGWGLFERLSFGEDGTPQSATLMDYVIPRSTQSPDLQAVLVEVPSRVGPYGAKGVGEPPVVPGAAAIANAVCAAVGARVTSIPITAEKVLEALQAS